MTRILLVGENNPYAGPEAALYPFPVQASGGRLATFLGLTAAEYVGTYDRVNLCVGDWSPPEARQRALGILDGTEPVAHGFDHTFEVPDAPHRKIVLVGAKVSNAFKHRKPEFAIAARRQLGRRNQFLMRIPHPSGRNPFWHRDNAPGILRSAMRTFASL